MSNYFGVREKIGNIRKTVSREFSLPNQTQGKLGGAPNQRLKKTCLVLGIFLVFMAFSLRLLQLQIAQGAKNLYLAEGNRIRLTRTPAPRGIIFDKNKTALVSNFVRSDLEIVPAELPKEKDEQQKVFEKISQTTGIDLTKIRQEVLSRGLFSIDPIIVKEDLNQEESLRWQIKLEGTKGASIALKPLRRYSSEAGLAHILGYIGKISEDELEENRSYFITDWIGKTGLEKIYQNKLRGTDGQKQVEVDATGRLQRMIGETAPQKGQDIDLYLDINLQRRAFEALKKKTTESGNGKGVAIAINPQNGGVLALVSLPDFDNNLFVKKDNQEAIYQLFNDENDPLVNRAVSGVYPIGSTIKPLVAAIALEEKVVSENYKVDTPSEIKIGEWVFPDWKDHGLTDIRRAIAESNNIFFYALGGGWDKIQGLGIDRLQKGLKEFNLGSLTGIDVPGEKYGLVPGRDWKKQTKKEKWYLGDTYHMSIGQGDLSATPIQLANAVSAIANQGIMSAPRLLNDGRTKIIKNNFISERNLAIVRQGMKMAWEEGSARAIQGIKDKNGNEIVGGAKTGTAQTGKKNQNGDNITHAWFVAFAPYENPQIAVLVLVEEGGEGYTSALPVAREILEEYFKGLSPNALLDAK